MPPRRERAGVVVAGVFLLLAAFICFEALLVPVGTVRMPGAGFFPLLLGVTLGVLAVTLFGLSLLGANQEPMRVWPDQPEVLHLVGILVVAIALFERVGFVITMALFLGASMRVLGTRRWGMLVTLSLVGSIGAYVVFSRILLIALPSGILPF